MSETAMGGMFVQWFLQLVVQSPVLIVYVIGIVLAVLHWRRGPTTSVLVLAAMMIMLVVMVGQSFLSFYLIHSREQWGWSAERIGQVLGVIGVGCGLARAAALAMLLGAVFWRRKA